MTDSIHVLPRQDNPVPSEVRPIEQLFLNHYDLVYRTAYRVTGNGTDAEDVLQTLFTRMLKKAPPDIETGWPAYLRRAAVNISLDLIRRRARGVSLGDMEPWIESSEPDPHRKHESLEVGDRLRAALANMNSTAAGMFVLRHVEGYSNREIAQMVGTSSGSVAVTLFRARGLLRKSLKTFRGGRA
jgi:RNA polymerase sigma-70 factor (ECF subfamily)